MVTKLVTKTAAKRDSQIVTESGAREKLLIDLW
jgi:hypothetical protein